MHILHMLCLECCSAFGFSLCPDHPRKGLLSVHFMIIDAIWNQEVSMIKAGKTALTYLSVMGGGSSAMRLNASLT